MLNVFNVIQKNFFNCLASGSNNQIYAECIYLIYSKYENEISYRLPRDDIKGYLEFFLKDTNAAEIITDEDVLDRNESEMASNIIRKFVEVGWLEEEIDDTTYQRQIIISENGIMLAELLERLAEPKREEFANYILNIYSRLTNPMQWEEYPYAFCLVPVFEDSKKLSKSLKMLSTFIRRTIEELMKEKSFKSLTENIIEYCEGDFIKEYQRLTKSQSIYSFRPEIIQRLEEFQSNQSRMEALISNCASEHEISMNIARDKVEDMIQQTIHFIRYEYDSIISDIRGKINVYLNIAVARGRFLRNRDTDVKGSVEQTLRYIANEMNNLDLKDNIPGDMMDLFAIETNEFIDLESIWLKGKERVISQPVKQKIKKLSPEKIAEVRARQEQEAYDPFSKDKMKSYLDLKMKGKVRITSSDMPFRTKNEMLANLAAVAYADENGYRVTPAEGYHVHDGFMLRAFEIRRKGE